MFNLAKVRLDKLLLSLKSQQGINNLISGIFYNIPANQPYPIIHLSNISLKNFGVKSTACTEVVFELTIYTKATDFELLNQISEAVLAILKTEEDLIIRSSKIELSSKTNIYENKIILKFITNEDY